MSTSEKKPKYIVTRVDSKYSISIYRLKELKNGVYETIYESYDATGIKIYFHRLVREEQMKNVKFDVTETTILESEEVLC